MESLNEGALFSPASKHRLKTEPLSFRYYKDYDAYLRHPVFLAARAVAMRMAEYRCSCGAPATEVHHRQYPPWGTFDLPSNLEPVCHSCHCRLEGKPS
jgi:hypothetical protein